MKKYFYIGFFALLATTVACASKKKTQNDQMTTTTNTSVTPVETTDEVSQTDSPVTVEKVDKSDTLFASYERGACFGRCKMYSLEIYKSGYAIYTGKGNVDNIGTYTTNFSQEQLKSLETIAKEINYFSLSDTYNTPPISDFPAITTSIALDGKRKKVMRKHNFPESILLLENAMDELINQADWKKKD